MNTYSVVIRNMGTVQAFYVEAETPADAVRQVFDNTGHATYFQSIEVVKLQPLEVSPSE